MSASPGLPDKINPQYIYNIYKNDSLPPGIRFYGYTTPGYTVQKASAPKLTNSTTGVIFLAIQSIEVDGLKLQLYDCVQVNDEALLMFLGAQIIQDYVVLHVIDMMSLFVVGGNAADYYTDFTSMYMSLI